MFCYLTFADPLLNASLTTPLCVFKIRSIIIQWHGKANTLVTALQHQYCSCVTFTCAPLVIVSMLKACHCFNDTSNM